MEHPLMETTTSRKQGNGKIRGKTKGTVGTRHRSTGRPVAQTQTLRPTETCFHSMHTHTDMSVMHTHTRTGSHTAHMQTTHMFMVWMKSHSQGRTWPELKCTVHILFSFCETTSAREDEKKEPKSQPYPLLKVHQRYFHLNWSQHQHVIT